MDPHSNNQCLTEHMILMKTRANSLTDVKQLNMWGFNLRDVSICTQMPNAELVVLSVNNISELAPFANCRRLKELHLRRNAISDFAQLRSLANLHSLRTLSLSENPIADDPDYRRKVIKILPQIDVLDGVAVADNERCSRPQPEPKYAPTESKYAPTEPKYSPPESKYMPPPASEIIGQFMTVEKVPEFTHNEKTALAVPEFKYSAKTGDDEHQKALLSAVLALLPELSTSSISVVLASIIQRR